MKSISELLLNLDKIHTTKLGVMRIKRNLILDDDDVVDWCTKKILLKDAAITKKW